MARAKPVKIESYVLDVLLRDLVGHDKHPAAFLVFLHLYAISARQNWKAVPASLRDIAEATGLSKSAVQTALKRLQQRELIATRQAHRTATPAHRIRRHWA